MGLFIRLESLLSLVLLAPLRAVDRPHAAISVCFVTAISHAVGGVVVALRVAGEQRRLEEGLVRLLRQA
jgi:hypothetical protein